MSNYVSGATNIWNRCVVTNHVPMTKMLEPELSQFWLACGHTDKPQNAQLLVEKYLRLKKARIMRVDAGCMPKFLPNEIIYAFEWETLINEVNEHIAQLEDEQTQFFPVFFVPLGDGWTVVDNVAALMKGNHE